MVAIRHGLLHPCFSEDILAEYGGVLVRPKFGFPSDAVAALLAMLQAKGDLIQPRLSQVASPDPADTTFIECAVAGHADFIAKGNKRHFPDASYGPARVVNAAELLDRIAAEL